MTVVVLVAVSVAAVYAFLTMPGWLAMSINRSSLWKLRDEIYDARRSGELPRVEAVAHRIRIIELSIEWLPTLTPPAVFRMSKVTEPPQTSSAPAGAPLNAGDGAAAELLANFEEEFTRILTRHFLTGSWSSIILTLFSPGAWRLLSRVVTKKRYARANGERIGTEPRVDQWREGLITTERAAGHSDIGPARLAAA